MITQEITKEKLEQDKIIWKKYKDSLKPNRKSGVEILEYLKNKYVLVELDDNEYIKIVEDNIMMNECYAEKLPDNIKPIVKAFCLENIENGKELYKHENRDLEVWKNDDTKIFIGIDIVSGFYMVEGSSMLFDELCAYQGLDEMDLNNYVCTAQYIRCLKRFNLL